jgi:hypothetical protein
MKRNFSSKITLGGLAVVAIATSLLISPAKLGNQEPIIQPTTQPTTQKDEGSPVPPKINRDPSYDPSYDPVINPFLRIPSFNKRYETS